MRKLLIVALLATAATSAIAKKPEEKKPLDPNEMVCRTEPLIGTRLQTQKTCMTRSQWEQYQQDIRRTVQRVQDFKPNQGG